MSKIAVQPSFSTIYCKTLNTFIKVCYSSPYTCSAPQSKIPILSGGAASHPTPLVSLQFSFLVFLLTDHCPLITAHSCFKSLRCNTYEPPRKCCKQKTYAPANPFRCNTYKKQGGPSLRRSGICLPSPILELIPSPSPSPSKPARTPVLSSALLPALQPRKRPR
jgi:hypothetical protein